ncbi:hypothetical protein [Saccharopolyspora sp. 6V]|uniref:hypothetical protein n=1 Tax=Saccharopolyspora sp. 6V TaxID=2877239 RepID=UPI001CD4C3AE|nr:hypothetical protein [Saccharopolyspora sp. 6V]MCA1191644.1 hypothetical protein [Saccharopolyspora sp. 6V]
MAIPEAWESKTSSQEAENDPNYGRARARAHAGAGEYTADHESASGDNVVRPAHWQSQSTERDGAESTEMEVRHTPGVPARLKDVSKIWWSEALTTATEAFDGTVYRARPSSPRDRVERWRRAHWAGDVDSLRIAGKVLGFPPLVLSLVFDTARWFCTTLRFYVLLAIGLIVVVLIAVL